MDDCMVAQGAAMRSARSRMPCALARLCPTAHGLDGGTTPMPAVVIYTPRFCPYCMMAKRLLAKKGVAFQEVDVTGNPAARAELTAKANGRTTVPQIWIGTTHIG